MRLRNHSEGFPLARRDAGLPRSAGAPFGPAPIWSKATAIIAGVLASVSVAGCAIAGPYNPDNLAADQVGGVGRVCQTVMHVQPGEEHYDACVESLSDSMQSLNRGSALQQARGHCLDEGLSPDSPGWGECELQSAERQPVAARSPNLAISGVGQMQEPGSSKSYFSTSPHDVFRREQLSCARLGFDPADGAFAGCVASLQSALFAADNPAQ